MNGDDIRSWQVTAQLQGRVLAGISSDIEGAARYTGDEVASLIAAFRELARLNAEQEKRLADAISIARNPKLGERETGLAEFGQLIADTLNRVIALSIHYSREAVDMVYRLGDVVERLDEVERLAREVGRINRQTRMVAFNATIEAERAGAQGKGFQVVAHEIRNLSQAIDGLSDSIRDETTHVVRGVRDTHAKLVTVAGTDMSPNIAARQQVDQMMQALIAQNEAFTAHLAEAATAGERGRELARIVTTLQFQDRLQQVFDHLADYFRLLQNHLDSLQQGSPPATMAETQALNDHLAALLDGFGFDTGRARRLRKLACEGGNWADLAAPPAAGNMPEIELF